MHLFMHSYPKDTRNELLSSSRTIAFDPVEEMCLDSEISCVEAISFIVEEFA